MGKYPVRIFILPSKRGWEIRIGAKAVGRITEKCKDITSRSNGMSERARIDKLQSVINGWVNYFVIARAKTVMQDLDGLVRTRMRICRWKVWKKPSTRVKRLMKLGVPRQKAYQWGNSSKGYCRIAHSPILCRTMNNQYFAKQGYKGFYNTYDGKTDAQYTGFAYKYKEEFLRRILQRVLTIPQDQIRKTRGALFTYLIKQNGSGFGN